MVSDSAPMALDDEVEPIDSTPAKDNDGIPYCRKHHCRMTIASGGKKGAPTAYYRCQVAKCEEKGQRIKTAKEGVVPPEPMGCPRCSTEKTPVYCERDAKCSTAAMVILKCPRCSWKSSGLVVPQLAAAHFARGPAFAPLENIGDR